ncbi:MAG TPA: FecR domain-containing protein, partial [Pyrinomonadaceae bacterium]|nr:FecR domain-containing protein [Pyrinomonadaceae bacterium]
MNRVRFWPYGALVVLAFAVVASIAGVLWMKYERRAEASPLPNAARIERVEGEVGINQSTDSTGNSQWTTATANTPVSVGDRIYTKQNSRTQIGFTGRNLATVDANTSLDVLDLSEQRTQVALREGSALFDVGSVASGNLFEVA